MSRNWIMIPVSLLVFLSSCTMIRGPSTPNYIVFFQQHSAMLDPAAAAIIARASAKARTMPSSIVTVYGYTDSAGSPQADVILSQQRAQHVTDALVADGVTAGQIVRQGRGQTGEDPGVSSRRVEITISP